MVVPEERTIREPPLATSLRTSPTLVAAALTLFAGTALAADPGVISVPTAKGRDTLRVIGDTNDPWVFIEPTSKDLRAKVPGLAPQQPIDALTCVVVVNTENPAALRKVAARMRLAAEPADGIPGFWLVDAGSVKTALKLANTLRATPGIKEAYLAEHNEIADRGDDGPIPGTDPLFTDQWHLLNDVVIGADLNVVPAWDMGFTGAGILIVQAETSGANFTHEDLSAHYVAEHSQVGATNGQHATRVAGIMSAVGLNGLGVRGVAYDSNFCTQYVSSAERIAEAFVWHNEAIDVKNNSWGPVDNNGIRYLTSIERAAFEEAVSSGRNGLGQILVFAAGNGGSTDRVDYDPYASSRFTISVGWINDADTVSVIHASNGSEPGASLMVVAPSNAIGHRAIVTTNHGPNPYTTIFGGSSAASPMCAGTVALMLQARPDLTWRDVQHVLVNSARKNDPSNSGWTVNAAGHDISHIYGFGAIDAAAAVTLAQTWPLVGPPVSTSAIDVAGVVIPDNTDTWTERTINIADNIKIEHVEVSLDATHTYRGDLELELVSPSGTTSVLATRHNDPNDHYASYVFTTVRNWDEMSAGNWTLRLRDTVDPDEGTLNSWTLTIHGTAPVPFCAGDVDNSGFVNVDDLNFVLSNWLTGPNALREQGDVTGDGWVNVDDLNTVITDWSNLCTTSQ